MPVRAETPEVDRRSCQMASPGCQTGVICWTIRKPETECCGIILLVVEFFLRKNGLEKE